jgi:membrane peptidoglycan carboxypeptidase
VLPGGKVDRSAGWGRPDAKRAVSDAVAAKVTDILEQNALYGTGAGSGDGIHPTAGKTGTTEDHADAWYVGYTRDLSTAVWMGYPRGEIPMVSVHGQTVAGATFPVPIWHAYMSAAEWGRPARPFLEPTREIVYRDFDQEYYGYTYTPSYSQPATTEEEEEEEEPAATGPADTPPAVAPGSTSEPKPTIVATPPPAAPRTQAPARAPP